MCCDLSEFVRWDAAHKRSIRIEHQDVPNEENWVERSRKYFGLHVYSLHAGVAEIFGAPAVKSEAVDEAIRLARECGDCVLYMFLLEHSGYCFRIQDSCPASSWDSGCCGVITVSSLTRERWLQYGSGKPFNVEYVAKFFGNMYDDQVEAELNGSFYMAVIDGQEPDECYIRTGYLSPEEALEDAMAEEPDICLTEDEVDEIEANATKVITLRDAENLLGMLEDARGAIGRDIVHGRVNGDSSIDICGNIVATVEYRVVRRWLEGFFPEKYQGQHPDAGEGYPDDAEYEAEYEACGFERQALTS